MGAVGRIGNGTFAIAHLDIEIIRGRLVQVFQPVRTCRMGNQFIAASF